MITEDENTHIMEYILENLHRCIKTISEHYDNGRIQYRFQINQCYISLEYIEHTFETIYLSNGCYGVISPDKISHTVYTNIFRRSLESNFKTKKPNSALYTLIKEKLEELIKIKKSHDKKENLLKLKKLLTEPN